MSLSFIELSRQPTNNRMNQSNRRRSFTDVHDWRNYFSSSNQQQLIQTLQQQRTNLHEENANNESNDDTAKYLLVFIKNYPETANSANIMHQSSVFKKAKHDLRTIPFKGDKTATLLQFRPHAMLFLYFMATSLYEGANLARFLVDSHNGSLFPPIQEFFYYSTGTGLLSASEIITLPFSTIFLWLFLRARRLKTSTNFSEGEILKIYFSEGATLSKGASMSNQSLRRSTDHTVSFFFTQQKAFDLKIFFSYIFPVFIFPLRHSQIQQKGRKWMSSRTTRTSTQIHKSTNKRALIELVSALNLYVLK